jgi:DNA adenine methylase
MWIGGKHWQAGWIVEHFPVHRCYVEPFGGGGHVLTRKEPSPVEVYNDVDGNLVNFLLVVRARPEEMVRALNDLPYSRALYRQWAREPLPEEPFERAVRWFYLMRSSFSASWPPTGWSYGKSRNQASRFQTTIGLLPTFAGRFKRVYIENLNFRECIRRYDGPETLFYCDPPYVGKAWYPEHPFGEQDHRDLAAILHGARGKVVLSSYPHPLIDELYPDWRRDERRFVVFSYGVTRQSKAKTKPKATELLLMNFEMEH